MCVDRSDKVTALLKPNKKPRPDGRGFMVGETGLEPVRPCGHSILSAARLPVPPLPRVELVHTCVRGRGLTKLEMTSRASLEAGCF